MNEMFQNAKSAKASVSLLTTAQKNAALCAMADAIERRSEQILLANAEDMRCATGISPVMLDRLRLTAERIADMAQGIRNVAKLPDPVGRVLEKRVLENGLNIQRIAVPIGVVAIIYESRPNVTSDAAALALKSGNVCILRSGKEAFRSASAIVEAMREGLQDAGVTKYAVNLVTDTSRASAAELMTASGYVDLLIPRGGAGLIRACLAQATVPCIQTGTGICHIYVEKSADLAMAVNIVRNAKTSRPSVCNAAEVLLVDRQIAPEFLPMLKKALVDDRIVAGEVPVELRLDADCLKIIDGSTASDTDFDTEFLDYILAVRCVDSTAEAVSHIAAHSTGHSEAIVTNDDCAKAQFSAGVDSAAVYINASTRFTDGGVFGLGCEMGISTQKLHARGPIGLQELTSYKYIITGNGNIR